VATICTVGAQILFLANFFQALLRRRLMENNPWCATTLEWSVASPAPENNFDGALPIVYRGAYEFGEGHAVDFAPQHLAPELLAAKGR
jgi:cytochrome c oxidase subunit 1